MLKNGQIYFKILRCEDRESFKVCLFSFQYYKIKGQLKTISSNHFSSRKLWRICSWFPVPPVPYPLI